MPDRHFWPSDSPLLAPKYARAEIGISADGILSVKPNDDDFPGQYSWDVGVFFGRISLGLFGECTSPPCQVQLGVGKFFNVAT